MASISVTYTFTNSTTADATQVNTNFTDLINGTSDGTKDFSIGTLTVGGACTFNGSVALGDGSPDNITVSGSLASSFPIKTNNLYDFGSSTLGLASVYLGGSTGSLTTRLKSGATGSSWTLTFPTTTGTSGYILSTDGTGVSTWSAPERGPATESNYTFSTSVATNAMTINLLDGAGATPTASSPVRVAFRNATAATGDFSIVSVTSALSVVVSSGATLGHTSAVNQYIHVWAMNNAGTIELVVSGSKFFDEGTTQSTTAISGSATSATTLYSTSGRASKAIRYLGRVLSNQTTAGTYASNSTEIALAQGNGIQATSITQWESSLSASFAFGAVGTDSNRSIWTRRIGDTLEVRGHCKTGTCTGSNASVTLPSGYSIDYTKYPSTASVQIVGVFRDIRTGGAGADTSQQLFVDGSDVSNIFLSNASASNALTKVVGTSAFTDGDGFSFFFAVAIKEWRSF
jgi:hypothetical protein